MVNNWLVNRDSGHQCPITYFTYPLLLGHPESPSPRALRAGRHPPLYLRHIWSIFAISFIFGEDTRNVAKIPHGSIRLFKEAQHPYVARNHVVYRRYEGAPRKTSALRGDEAGRAGKPRRGRENTEHERVKQNREYRDLGQKASRPDGREGRAEEPRRARDSRIQVRARSTKGTMPYP